MSLFAKLKRFMAVSATAVLTASMTLSPVASAYAETTNTAAADTSSDPIVGNLAIVSMFNKGVSTVNDGHSFVVFTSYKDNLDLNFTDLCGYYEMTDEFKATTKADTSQLSWKANFDDFSAKYGNGISLADYLKYSEDERESSSFEYHSLWQAIYDYGNTCYTYTQGTQQTDTRYYKTSYNCTLNTGEYITVGDYVFSDTGEMIKNIFLKSSAKSDFDAIMNKYAPDQTKQQEITSKLITFIGRYLSGEDANTLATELMVYMKDQLGEEGAAEFKELVSSLENRRKLLDGDAAGGVFVNRELWRQKVYQTIYPNIVYSIDITQSQLDRMMAYYNSGTENHYAALAHNCSSVSSGAWNAAVGTDASGSKTALYVDAADESIEVFKGLFDTPQKVYDVIESWKDKGLGGKVDSWEIIHGVDVPQCTVTFDTGDGGSAVESQTVNINACATKPEDPTREGYTFKGWLLNGEAYDFGTPVTGTITLTASWEKNADPTPDPDPDPDPEPTPDPTPEPDSDTKPSKKTDGNLPQTGDSAYLAAVPLAVLGAAALVIARRRLA